MTLKIGVVGVLYGSTVHLPGLISEGQDVVAVCARRPESAEAAANRFGVPNAFTSYEEMLAMPELDAVAIASPVHLHAEMTALALKAGKHVLCEKPFTLTAPQAEGVLELHAGTGLTAMVGHEFRFASGRMAAKELIDAGYLGLLRLAVCRLILPPAQGSGVVREYDEERDTVAKGGGLLLSQGSHYVDGFRHLFGEVVEVTGDLASFAPERLHDDEIVLVDADDTFTFSLRFENGGIGTMIASRATVLGDETSISMYGSAGTLITPQHGMNPPSHGRLLGARLGDTELAELEIPDRLQPFVDDRDDRLMPFRLLVREFERGIDEGISPSPNLYDAYRCQQVLDAIRESARSGRRITLPPV